MKLLHQDDTRSVYFDGRNVYFEGKSYPRTSIDLATNLEEPISLPFEFKFKIKNLDDYVYFCGKVIPKNIIGVILEARKEAQERYQNDLKAVYGKIEGLDEIRRAKAEWDAFDGIVKTTGIKPKTVPESDIGLLCEKYPKALLFLEAEEQAKSKDYFINANGREAMRLLLEGADVKKVEELLEG